MILADLKKVVDAYCKEGYSHWPVEMYIMPRPGCDLPFIDDLGQVMRTKRAPGSTIGRIILKAD